MGRGVDVWAGIRVLKPRRGNRAKVAVEFRAPQLIFAPENKQIAAELATTLTATWRSMMLAGQWLDGRPLPGVSPRTVERRRYRLAQIAGPATPSLGLTGRARSAARRKFRVSHRSLKRLRRRYETRKQGTTLPTAEISGRGVFGLESGTLARSLAVAPVGDAWRIFVSDLRGILGRSGQSAWLRVLKRMGGLGRMSTVLSSPEVQAALAGAYAASWKGSGARSLRRLASELARLRANTQALANEIDEALDE